MSQSELSSLVGYRSRSAIAGIESDKIELPASRLLALARALDTSVESLLSDLDPLGDLSSDLHVRPGSRNAAIILAGGHSARNLQNAPNQFLSVLGRPVFSWCLNTYQLHPMIDDIVIVCLEGWEEVVWAYARKGGVSKLRDVVEAGESGVKSAIVGVKRLRDMGYHGDDIVVIQESTRPLVSQEMVSRILLACHRTGSAVTCGSMVDNVQFLRTDKGWSRINRESVVDLQSPDAYTMSVLDEAIERAGQSGYPMDDNSCAMMLHALGYDLNFCEAGQRNMKIVRREDLAVFEALARAQL